MKKKAIEELKDVKESLEFKVGYPTYFTMKDGHTYTGTVLGIEGNDIYLKNVTVLDVEIEDDNLKLDYMKAYKTEICTQIKI